MNYQGLLEACLVGKLVDGPKPIKEKPSLPSPGETSSNAYLLATPSTLIASSKPVSVKQKLSGLFCGLCSGKTSVSAWNVHSHCTFRFHFCAFPIKFFLQFCPPSLPSQLLQTWTSPKQRERLQYVFTLEGDYIITYIRSVNTILL